VNGENFAVRLSLLFGGLGSYRWLPVCAIYIIFMVLVLLVAMSLLGVYIMSIYGPNLKSVS
jgi:hypothetical protein